MTKIDGLQTYRIYVSLRLHLSDRGFHYKFPIPITWEKFQSNRYMDVYEYLSYNYTEEFLFEYFLANLISNPNLQPAMLKNKNGIKIHEKWKREIDTIDTTFTTELVNLCEKFNFSNANEMFTAIHKSINKKLSSEVVTITSINQMIDDVVEIDIGCDNELFNFISNMNVHFIIVLDEIMKQYWRYSFLEDYILTNPDIKEHSLITAKKYKSLLPVDTYMFKGKIKDFIEYVFL